MTTEKDRVRKLAEKAIIISVVQDGYMTYGVLETIERASRLLLKEIKRAERRGFTNGLEAAVKAVELGDKLNDAIRNRRKV